MLDALLDEFLAVRDGDNDDYSNGYLEGLKTAMTIVKSHAR